MYAPPRDVLGAAEHPEGQPSQVERQHLAGDLVPAIPEQRVLVVPVLVVLMDDQLGEQAEQLVGRVARGLRQMRPGEALADHHGATSGPYPNAFSDSPSTCSQPSCSSGGKSRRQRPIDSAGSLTVRWPSLS